MAAQLRVVTVLGTRPEIIRLSEVIRALDQHVDHILVHTGQNYDHELSQIFFAGLGVRPPDHFLGVGGGSVAATYANVLLGSEKVFNELRPDAVLVLGDTNSAIAALIAKRMRIPVYHMEAGNRSFDLNVPEEINRRIIDHISDFNLVYTERSRGHLLAEGIPHRLVYLTGSPLREVLTKQREGIEASSVLADLGLTGNGFFVASMHREENVDDAQRLARVLSALRHLGTSFGLPVVVSTHPRTRARIGEAGLADAATGLRLLTPLGFHDYARLQLEARCVVSDSGTVSEEAAILGFPAVTLRDSMERPEALDTGSIVMSTLDPDALLESVRLQVALHDAGQGATRPAEYDIPDTAARVVRLIVSTARLAHLWTGVRPDFARR